MQRRTLDLQAYVRVHDLVATDADLVVCCDYRRSGDHSGGQIKYRGVIDVEQIREEIKRVMEGGERAFQLRRAKYGF